METWDELMKQGGMDSYDNYMGSHDHANHYVCLSRTRDSDALENSNFETALKMLGGESDTVYTLSFNHWAVGWLEHIFIDPTDIDAVRIGTEIQESLQDYPVLDEEDFSRREWEEWEESYNFNCRSDLINRIESLEQDAETFFFLDEEGNIELDDDQEAMLFHHATENASQSSFESWDVNEIVHNFLEEAIKPYYVKHPDLFEPNDTPIIVPEIQEARNRLLSMIGD